MKNKNQQIKIEHDKFNGDMISITNNGYQWLTFPINKDLAKEMQELLNKQYNNEKQTKTTNMITGDLKILSDLVQFLINEFDYLCNDSRTPDSVYRLLNQIKNTSIKLKREIDVTRELLISNNEQLKEETNEEKS